MTGAGYNEKLIAPNFSILDKDGITKKSAWKNDIKPKVLQELGTLGIVEVSRDPKTNSIKTGFANLGDDGTGNLTFKGEYGNEMNPQATQAYISNYLNESNIDPLVMPYVDISKIIPTFATNKSEEEMEAINDKFSGSFIIDVVDPNGNSHKVMIENRGFYDGNSKYGSDWDRKVISPGSNGTVERQMSDVINNIPIGGTGVFKYPIGINETTGKPVFIGAKIYRYSDGYKFTKIGNGGKESKKSNKYRGKTALHDSLNTSMNMDSRLYYNRQMESKENAQ
jgi:hypothetical protein